MNTPTPGTYNLNGGLLQVESIHKYAIVGNDGRRGHLQLHRRDAPGQQRDGGIYQFRVAITVGANASNVATFDANGQTVDLG